MLRSETDCSFPEYRRIAKCVEWEDVTYSWHLIRVSVSDNLRHSKTELTTETTKKKTQVLHLCKAAWQNCMCLFPTKENKNYKCLSERTHDHVKGQLSRLRLTEQNNSIIHVHSPRFSNGRASTLTTVTRVSMWHLQIQVLNLLFILSLQMEKLTVVKAEIESSNQNAKLWIWRQCEKLGFLFMFWFVYFKTCCLSQICHFASWCEEFGLCSLFHRNCSQCLTLTNPWLNYYAETTTGIRWKKKKI